MKAGSLSTFVARVDAAELGLCRTLNALSRRTPMRRLFQLVSRLGNGMIWYALLQALPL
jgi:undecaprenyl-diphosphatase